MNFNLGFQACLDSGEQGAGKSDKTSYWFRSRFTIGIKRCISACYVTLNQLKLRYKYLSLRLLTSRLNIYFRGAHG